MRPIILRRTLSCFGSLAVTGLLAGSLNASANLISNGSFESPVGKLQPGVNNGYPTDWSGFGSMQIVNGQPSSSYPKAHDGEQYVSTSNGSLTQGFAVSDADDYTLSWFQNTLTTGFNGSYVVRVRDAASGTVKSQVFSFSTSGASPWKEEKIDLSLTPGSYSLEFEPGSSGTFIDLVSLEPVRTPTVPDGGPSWEMLTLAVGGLGWWTKRWKTW